MKHISVASLKEIIDAEKDNPAIDFVNVCTPAEYKEKTIPGTRNVPLDEIDQHIDEFREKKRIYIHCRSGKRGARAIERLSALGLSAELINVEGGLLAWDEAGFPTDSQTNRLPIMRQTFIAAGALILLGYALSLMFHPSFIFVSVFVGVGLLFAGATGHCGMSYVLARMPWNR